MAELLSALLPTLLQKAGDSLLTELAFMRGIDGRRKRLCVLLTAINDVISDAEEQASKKLSVKDWTSRLKSAALDADNAIDELCYEVLRRVALRRGHNVNNGVTGFFSMNYNPLIFKYRLGKRLQEIVERIDELVNQMNKFGFTRDQHGPVVDSRQTHSYVKEDDVIGRKVDEDIIVCRVLSNESEKLTIIPVVGMGGMGKTTLAQLVFNDRRVSAHFQICVWVCVSEPFIVADVIKMIIDSAIGKDSELKTDNMELLQRRLRDELGGKRYFLVLDDVWNQDEAKWEALRALLGCGGMGSVVLVTTREEKVAFIMGAPDAYCLKHLNQEDSWTLFEKRAFSLGLMESPDLVEVGKEIVKKCCGVPLALKTMGSLMSRKHEVKEWLAILESKTWDEENQIMPALRLSYHHLPSHMKQCFVFCAVFPKDYEMKKKDLIHLWIANGFISSEGNLDSETVGNQVFSELVWRSFFQDVKQERSRDWGHYGYCDISTCKIHDLLHDLAQIIGNGEYFSMQKLDEINELPANVLHLHCNDDVYFQSQKIGLVVQRHPNIRSIFYTHDYSGVPKQEFYFPNSSLRVFSHCWTLTETLVIRPAFMKHLRYLDLTESCMSTLPSSISALYNLQVLVLNDCRRLKLLPDGMKFMISLRHLYLDGCDSLEGMPADLGQLKHLRTLTKYVVGKDSGRGIEELKNLKLGGNLQIYGLMNVTSQSDAKEANLETKQNLEQLTLSWAGYKESPPQDSSVYPFEEILDALKPHNRLQVLNLIGYMGPRFSTWVTDSLTLQRLVELKLSDCVNCINIPPVWQLPCLEVLRLEGMCNLTYLCNSQCMVEEGCLNPASPIFPKLKKLSLERLELMERWKENDTVEVSSVIFPALDDMEIIDCPKLTTLPKVPVLRSFSLTGNKVQIDSAASLTTLSTLSMKCLMSPKWLNDPSVSKQNSDIKENMLVEDSLPWSSLANLSLEKFSGLIPHDKEHKSSDQMIHIRTLSLFKCDFFIQRDNLQSPLWYWKLFVNLERLDIEKCYSLTFWPEEEFQSLSLLKWLRISKCKNFTGLPPALLSVTPTADEGLHNLEDLEIFDCPNLVAFPTSFTCLKRLSIWSSSKLESIPEGLGHQLGGTLEYLSIGDCPNLNSLPASMCHLSNLTFLFLGQCNSLTALPEGMDNLTALETLDISNCPCIKVLPEGLQQRLHSLEELSIKGCPALARRCKRGGDYWDKIKDIPGLEVIAEEHSVWRDAARAYHSYMHKHVVQKAIKCSRAGVINFHSEDINLSNGVHHSEYISELVAEKLKPCMYKLHRQIVYILARLDWHSVAQE